MRICVWTIALFAVACLGVVGAQQCSGDTAYIWPSAQISVAGEPGTTYDPHMQCGFVIQPTLGSSLITLEFDYFDTEDGYDFVRVYDTFGGGGSPLAEYTGVSLPVAVSSSTGLMYVTFASDSSVEQSGFKATYYALCPNGQTWSETYNSGTLSDGSGSNSYTDNMSCAFAVSPGSIDTSTERLVLTFTAFDVEDTPGCSADALTVYDGTSSSDPVAATLCGTVLPAPIILSSGNAFLTFTSDSAVTAGGWSLSYSVIPSYYCLALGTQLLVGDTDSFSDGSGNGNAYFPYTNCAWHIQPASATSSSIIIIRFDMLSLPDTSPCTDKVLVYAGVDATAPLRATVCGSASTTVSVPGTDAYVVFVTGSGNAGSLDGFTASYTLTTATPCASSVTLTDPASAVLTDGYAAVGYAAGLACDFIVAPSSPLGAITLNFERFELGPNDIISIYSGASPSSDTLLGTLTGAASVGSQSSNLNIDFDFAGLGVTQPRLTFQYDVLTVRFASDAGVGGGSGTGFSIRFDTFNPENQCNGLVIYAGNSGTVVDGPVGVDYTNDAVCDFVLLPLNYQGAINIDWVTFETEESFDYVRVYTVIGSADAAQGTSPLASLTCQRRDSANAAE